MDSESTVTMCYRHPAVECHVRCTRCERYICPDCVRQAPVGHQCPACVREGARSVRQARTIVGGRMSTTPVVTYVLFALNVLAYLAEVVRPEIVDRFAMVGARLVGPGGEYYTGGGRTSRRGRCGPRASPGVSGSACSPVRSFTSRPSRASSGSCTSR